MTLHTPIREALSQALIETQAADGLPLQPTG
jgi:hypothetical protein